MRLLVINPNTTAAMTERLVSEAARFAGPGWTVEGATARFGHEVIASRVSFAIGAHAALDAYETYAAAHGWPDAVLLGCFGDPGLAALREVAPGTPVAGLAQASIQQALRVGERFAIVTAGAAWREMLLETVRLERAEERLVDIFVLDGTGLAVSRDPEAFLARVQELADMARAAGADAVVLGGAGFAGFAGMAGGLRGDVAAIDCIEAGTRAVVDAACPLGG